MMPIIVHNHEKFMDEAIRQAHLALAQDEVPIGAVVVDAHGEIIARGYNQVEQCFSQSMHAEIIALRQAGEALKNWRLEGCWIYVTLEPCALCMQMILLSRVQGVVYGATSPLFGFHLDNGTVAQLYKNQNLVLIAGIKEQEAQDMLKKFFRSKRESKP